MKKLAISFLLVTMVFVPIALAQEEHSHIHTEAAAVTKVYRCPMDGYTSEKPGKCTLCGMDLLETEVTTQEAEAIKAALEKK